MCIESLVEMIGPLSVHYTTCNRGGLGSQAPLSMEFPKQEYWSGLPFPSPGNLANPGTELMSPVLAYRFFTAEPPGKPM